MAELSYPQNLPYMQTSSTRLSRNGDSEGNEKGHSESSNSEALMQRIQDLERELSSLNTLLMEDGGFQQAYAQLQQENEQLKAIINDQGYGSQQIKELQISNQLLKENLLKQNEEMEDLYRDLQQARNSNSRMQQRGHSQLLESKVHSLDEEVSSLLGKIHALMQQNNELIAKSQEMGEHIEHLQKNLEDSENRVKELQMENEILKQEIHNVEEMSIGQQKNVQDTYMNQLEEANEQIEGLKAGLQKAQAQARPGQIRGNTERISEDRLTNDQEIVSLRNELASKNEELLWQKENEANMRRKYEERMAVDEGDMMAMNQQLSKLRSRLRQQQSKCSEYEFVLQQQQKDKERLNFYKNSYADSEQLRSTIIRMQAEKEQLTLKVERLKAELSQRKMEQVTVEVDRDRKEVHRFMNEQSQDELERSKKLIKELKQAIGKYEQDYKQLREDYERLLSEKIEAQRVININQVELQRHKAIYEQLVVRYNDTSSLYKELQHKLKTLQAERNVKPSQTNYDKENVQLVKLENSTLRQQINSLKQQISQLMSSNTQRTQADSQDFRRQISQLKRRQREYSQQLELYRQKYLKQLEKSRGDKQLQHRVSDLQGKLSRVNGLLNEKLKEIDYLHNRQNELMLEVDQIYDKCRLQFDNFGIRHHPEVKKLHSELLSAQRQLMESELTFKQQISAVQDELRACRLENQHHRAKIDELLQEVNRERNSLDYSKLMRSLQLSQLNEKEMRSELQQREQLINDLREQLKRLQTKQRNRAEASVTNLKQSRSSQLSRYQQLSRKKSQVIEQFKYSQQFLGNAVREQRQGILQRIRENIGS